MIGRTTHASGAVRRRSPPPLPPMPASAIHAASRRRGSDGRSRARSPCDAHASAGPRSSRSCHTTRGPDRRSTTVRHSARVGLASGSARSRRPGFGPRLRASRSSTDPDPARPVVPEAQVPKRAPSGDAGPEPAVDHAMQRCDPGWRTADRAVSGGTTTRRGVSAATMRTWRLVRVRTAERPGWVRSDSVDRVAWTTTPRPGCAGGAGCAVCRAGDPVPGA